MVELTAPEHRADGTIGRARYAYAGDAATGWEVRREGRPQTLA